MRLAGVVQGGIESSHVYLPRLSWSAAAGRPFKVGALGGEFLDLPLLGQFRIATSWIESHGCIIIDVK